MKVLFAIMSISIFFIACNNQKMCDNIYFLDLNTVIDDLKINKSESQYYNQYSFNELLFLDLSVYNLILEIDKTKSIDTSGINAWQNNSGVIYNNPNIRSYSDLFCNKSYFNELLQHYASNFNPSSYTLDSLILVKQNKALFSVSNSHQDYFFLVTENYPVIKLQFVSSTIGCEIIPDEPINTIK